MYLHTCACMHAHTHAHKHAHVHARSTRFAPLHSRTLARTRTRTRTRTRIHMRAYARAQTYTVASVPPRPASALASSAAADRGRARCPAAENGVRPTAFGRCVWPDPRRGVLVLLWVGGRAGWVGDANRYHANTLYLQWVGRIACQVGRIACFIEIACQVGRRHLFARYWVRISGKRTHCSGQTRTHAPSGTARRCTARLLGQSCREGAARADASRRLAAADT